MEGNARQAEDDFSLNFNDENWEQFFFGGMERASASRGPLAAPGTFAENLRGTPGAPFSIQDPHPANEVAPYMQSRMEHDYSHIDPQLRRQSTLISTAHHNSQAIPTMPMGSMHDRPPKRQRVAPEGYIVPQNDSVGQIYPPLVPDSVVFAGPSFQLISSNPEPRYNPFYNSNGPPASVLSASHGAREPPVIEAPPVPSISFAFNIFKYPSRVDYEAHLSHQLSAVAWANFLHAVNNFPNIPNMDGRKVPSTLIDVAVYYLKSLNWDHADQLTMIHFVTILHNTQVANMHQWLWEIYTAADRALRQYPHTLPSFVEAFETIKSQVIRLSKVLLEYDMARYETRNRAVFGGPVEPAVWKLQHINVPYWAALGLSGFHGPAEKYPEIFLAMSTEKFMEAKIDPRGSSRPRAEAEDARGFF